MQVYRHLTIGVAKPSHDLRRRVTHHLIDICAPHEQFDTGRFVELAQQAIDTTHRAGRLPVVSGGSVFYLRNLLYGLPETPRTCPQIRGRLNTRLRHDGVAALYDELRAVDPGSADRISVRDEYRIVRALEIFYHSGRPLSSFQVPTTMRRDFDMVLIGLRRPRHDLWARIESRIDEMFCNGLSAEVCSLWRTGYDEQTPAMRGIGYREFFAAYGGPLIGNGADGGASSDCPEMTPGALKAVRDAIVVNTRQYAKRQLSFFRQLSGIRWYHPDDSSIAAQIDDALALLA